jgi:hypothetical protein
MSRSAVLKYLKRLHPTATADPHGCIESIRYRPDGVVMMTFDIPQAVPLVSAAPDEHHSH